MHALDLRAPAEVFVPRRAHSDLTEQRLRDYRPEVLGPVKALARRHTRLADLASSFPALLFALAHPREGTDPEPAIRAVIAGETLGQAARLAGVPLWLRRAGPKLFTAPLPALPDTTFLRRTIVNHLPRHAQQSASWFEIISAAAREGTDEFAVWCARHLARSRQKKLVHRLRLLSLWAWYSAQPDARGHALIERPFESNLTVASAIMSAEKWQIEVMLHLDLGGATIDDNWVAPAIVDGYEFKPLRNERAIRKEAREMQNCLRTYGYAVLMGRVRLWSVRKDGARVATLSLGRSSSLPLVSITEMKGVRNKAVPHEMLRAAQRWLFTHMLPEAEPQNAQFPAVELSRDSWTALWKPYWLAKQRVPDWLPLTPSRGAFGRL